MIGSRFADPGVGSIDCRVKPRSSSGMKLAAPAWVIALGDQRVRLGLNYRDACGRTSLPMPWVAPPPLPVLPDQFVQMIAGLRQVLAERAVERYRAGDQATTLLLNFICARLGRLSQRFTRLFAAVLAGRLPADRAGRRRAEPEADAPPGSGPGAGL